MHDSAVHGLDEFVEQVDTGDFDESALVGCRCLQVFTQSQHEGLLVLFDVFGLEGEDLVGEVVQ